MFQLLARLFNLSIALGFATMAFFQTFDYDPVFMSSNSTLPSTET